MSVASRSSKTARGRGLPALGRSPLAPGAAEGSWKTAFTTAPSPDPVRARSRRIPWAPAPPLVPESLGPLWADLSARGSIKALWWLDLAACRQGGSIGPWPGLSHLLRGQSFLAKLVRQLVLLKVNRVHVGAIEDVIVGDARCRSMRSAGSRRGPGCKSRKVLRRSVPRAVRGSDSVRPTFAVAGRCMTRHRGGPMKWTTSPGGQLRSCPIMGLLHRAARQRGRVAT